MPLDFKETEKKQDDKSIFFVTNRKLRPLSLDGEVLPDLIRKVGDWKSGRIAKWMVEQYLDRNTLIFDRDLLQKLFDEADYKKEGSLDARALGAALSGRYPMRTLTREWRQLAALLLGLEELVLQEDPNSPTRNLHTRPDGGGSFNSDSVWNRAPRPLPPVKRRPTKPQSPSGGDFAMLSTMASTTGILQSGGDATIRTTMGPKSVAPIAAEQTINQPLTSTTDAPRITFQSAKAFKDFSKGIELSSSLAVDTQPGAGRRALSATSSTLAPLTSDALNTTKSSVRAWSALLPPTAITLPTSTLQALRTSVRSTVRRKAEFEVPPVRLTTNEYDLRKTLGQPLDQELPLNRVEPVRQGKVLYNAGYTDWCDYAANCRTAPTRWYNEHPALPQEASAGEHKYPWC